MIDDLVQAVSSLLAQIPAPVLVVLLLAGPTAAWIAYRAASSSRSLRAAATRPDGFAIEPEYWQCPDCLSLTPIQQSTCYSCGFEPGRDDVDEPDGRVPVGTGGPNRNGGATPTGPGR